MGEPNKGMLLEERNKKSATAMGMWHCILSWFFMNAEDKHHVDNKEFPNAMKQVYAGMEAMRNIIVAAPKAKPEAGGDEDDTKSSKELIIDLAKKVNFIRDNISQARWAEEISSMMHELVAMHKALEKQRVDIIDRVVGDNFKPIQNYTEARHVACVITIWYWMAAWSSPVKTTKGDEMETEKIRQVFLNKASDHNQILCEQLFVNKNNPNSKAYNDDLNELLKLLHLMLKSNTPHWINVLDHFIESMKEAGKVRAKLKTTYAEGKKVLNMANDQASAATSGITIHPSIIKPNVSRSLGNLFTSTVLSGGELPLLSVVDEFKEPIGKVITDLPKTVEDVTEKVSGVANNAIGLGKEIVEGASDAVKSVVNGVSSAVSTIHDDVKDLVHGIGEGIHKFASTIAGWLHL